MKAEGRAKKEEMPGQLPLDFSSSSESPGIDAWRAARREQMEKLAAKQGLPLGHRVRVDFANGPSLEGILVLNENLLFLRDRADSRLHLRIGTSDFHANEIETCIRID